MIIKKCYLSFSILHRAVHNVIANWIKICLCWIFSISAMLFSVLIWFCVYNLLLCGLVKFELSWFTSDIIFFYYFDARIWYFLGDIYHIFLLYLHIGYNWNRFLLLLWCNFSFILFFLTSNIFNRKYFVFFIKFIRLFFFWVTRWNVRLISIFLLLIFFLVDNLNWFDGWHLVCPYFFHYLTIFFH